jgi:hypothetical protein
MTRTGLNPGRRGGKPAINRLSYGAARDYILNSATAVFFHILSNSLFIIIKSLNAM